MKLSVRSKLLGLSAVLIAFMLAIGLLSIVSLGSVNEQAESMYVDRAVPLMELGEASTAFMDLRRLAAYGVAVIDDPDSQAAIDTALAADKKLIDERLQSYAATAMLDTETAALADFQASYAEYMTGLDEVRSLTLAQDRAGSLLKVQSLADTGKGATAALTLLGDINAEEAGSLHEAIAATYESNRLIIIAALVAAFLIGFSLAFWLARRVVNGVKDVQDTLAMLSERDASAVAAAMEHLRDGDLTYDVQPVTPRIAKYGSDEIGKTAEYTNTMRDRIIAAIEAYNGARSGLTATMLEVRESAEAVTRTSEQLNEAATQTGAATQQVATTISQVAGGTAEQARAASDTNAAVEELSAVIQAVGRGAEDTSHAVGRSLEAVSSMQTALSASDQAREELAPVNAAAAAALTKVTEAIRESSEGMIRIKTAVDDSAVKVAELGAKGEQIGAIVETINDIAEQTNLLALNAAIEAARAGEMGKGFAVVADEVRKLAERSGRATKEIATLIGEVQQGTTDAVAAMGAGSVEVEQGLLVGKRSMQSLEEIEAATGARDQGASKIYSTLDAIKLAAGAMTTASDDIAKVVAQTAAGASQMAQASDSVTRSIGSIAAVSEENSAAAEEVSAATEEMSAQAEEVVASASTLADMAQQLDALVARFTLEQASAAERKAPATREVIGRRRADDWRRVA